MNVRELREVIEQLDPDLEVATAPQMIVPMVDGNGVSSVADFDNLFPIVGVVVGGKVGLYGTMESQAVFLFQRKIVDNPESEPPPS